MLYHEGPTVIRAMRDITVGVFEHIEITYNMDVDKIIEYMECILRGTALNKYIQDLTDLKDSAKGVSGYQWNMLAINNGNM